MKALRPSRILWLSDIHYRKYNDGPDVSDYGVENYINSFLDVLTNENEASPIDTVVITGDLAQAGKKEQYDALISDVISKIKNVLGDQTKLFTIPGNHDVLRTGVDGLFDELRSTDTDLSSVFRQYDKKRQLLLDQKMHYIRLFEDYSSFARKINSNPDIRGYSDPSDNHRLYGYCVDKENKIIYFLLNTAWFCMSHPLEEVSLQHLNQELDKATNKTELRATVDKILKVNKYTNENGGQLIGQQMFDNGIASILDDPYYHTYTKITLMHHPFHWLRWEEMYSYSETNGSLLYRLIHESDLILTGHEHVPEYIEPGLVSGRTWHIPAGMFLHHNVKKASLEGLTAFPHNRFSVLDVYSDRATESRFLYESKSGSWKKKDSFLSMPFKRSYKDVTGGGDVLIKSFASDLVKNVKSYFTKHWNIELTEIQQCKDTDPSASVKAFEDGPQSWLIICPRIYNYYKTALMREDHKNFINKMVREIIALRPHSSLSVAFFALDLTVNKDTYQLTAQDDKTHEMIRRERFGEIVQESDLYFDRFRHYFFRDNQSSTDFNRMAEINFVNIPVQYWRADRLTKS